jgi:hypothetical protein
MTGPVLKGKPPPTLGAKLGLVPENAADRAPRFPRHKISPWTFCIRTAEAVSATLQARRPMIATDRCDLQIQFENHLDRYCREPSLFLSVFSERSKPRKSGSS